MVRFVPGKGPIVILIVLGAVLSGVQPAHGEAEETPAGEDATAPTVEDLGVYEHNGQTHAIEAGHAEQGEDRIAIDVPTADKLRVEESVLDAKLGGWAANKEFAMSGNDVEVLDHEVVFEKFHPEIGGAASFSKGANESLRLADRPMWISVQRDGESIVLDLDDGNSAGQDVILSKHWLREVGIGRPVAEHEDGTSLEVTESSDGNGYVVGVPHFSQIILTPADIDVRERQGDQVTPHVALKRWDSTTRTLEVDVSTKASDVTVLVEAAWVDAHIPHLALVDHSWDLENVSGRWYYGVALQASETPGTLKFEEFRADGQRAFTVGNPDTIYGFDLPRFLAVTTPQPGVIRIVAGNSAGVGNLAANFLFLENSSISSPEIKLTEGAPLPTALASGVVQFPAVPKPGEDSVSVDILLADHPISSDLTCTGAYGTGIHHVYSWVGDEPGSGDKAAAYVAYNNVFCWDWAITPDDTFDPPNGIEVGTDDLDYFVVGASAIDPNDPSTGCAFAPSGDTEHKNFHGRIECTWPEAAIPRETTLIFHATAISLPNEPPPWWLSLGFILWLAKCVGEGVFFEAGVDYFLTTGALVASEVVALLGGAHATYCLWKFAVGGTAQYLPDDAYDRRQDPIITFQPNSPVITGGAVDMNIEDHNPYREDTWDALEGLPEPIHSFHWRGTQTVTWTVSEVKDARLTYHTDISTIRTSPATLDQPEFQSVFVENSYVNVTQRNDFESFTKEIVLHDDSAADKGGVDWEAPEIPLEATVSLLSTLQDGIQEITFGDPEGSGPGLAFEPSPQESDPWLTFGVLSTTLDPGAVISSGSISLEDVRLADGSVILALARAATTDSEFLQGDLSVSLPATLPVDYIYPSLMKGQTFGTQLPDGPEVESPTVSISVPITFEYFPT